MLGWVIEAATGRRFADVAAELVWSRIGAEFDANIGVDSEGSGMFDGGMSATLGDLARFGLMILRNGTSLTGDQVVPSWWVDDSFAGGPDSRARVRRLARRQPDARWLLSQPVLDSRCPASGAALPGHPRPDDLRQPRSAGVVAAKLSSWPTPQNAWKLFSTVAAFDAISADLAGA